MGDIVKIFEQKTLTILPQEPKGYNYAEIVINIQYKTANQIFPIVMFFTFPKTANQMGRALSVMLVK